MRENNREQRKTWLVLTAYRVDVRFYRHQPRSTSSRRPPPTPGTVRFVRSVVFIALSSSFSLLLESRPRYFDNGNCGREVASLSFDLVRDETLEICFSRQTCRRRTSSFYASLALLRRRRRRRVLLSVSRSRCTLSILYPSFVHFHLLSLRESQIRDNKVMSK